MLLGFLSLETGNVDNLHLIDCKDLRQDLHRDQWPQNISPTRLEMGVNDVWQESISMKKNRLACKLCVLMDEMSCAKIMECIFSNSSSIGVRVYRLQRFSLPRKPVSVDCDYGKVDVKVCM